MLTSYMHGHLALGMGIKYGDTHVHVFSCTYGHLQLASMKKGTISRTLRFHKYKKVNIISPGAKA